MSAIKNSKLWSTLALLASVLCLLAMAAIMLSYYNEQLSFSDASGHLRTAAKASFFALCFAALVTLFSWKNKASLIKALVAVALMLTPLMILKSNMPAGTDLFAPAGTGPPPGANAKGPSDPAKAPINDVSTDTQNPPAFSAVIPLRPESSSDIEYAGESAAAAQAAQYPDIKPITSSLPKAEAYDHALQLATDTGWEIIAQDTGSGIIEAVASTRFFKFTDDVIIRVSESGAQSIVEDPSGQSPYKETATPPTV